MSNYLFAIGERSKIEILKSKYSYSKEVTVTEISSTVSVLTVEKIADTITPGPLDSSNFSFYAKGFAIDNEAKQVYLGKKGFKNLFDNSDNLDLEIIGNEWEGAFTLALWNSDRAFIKTDLYCMSTLLYFFEKDVMVCSDSLYVLTKMRETLGLECIIDKDVASAKSWVYSLGNSPLCEDLVVKNIKLLLPGQHLSFDLKQFETKVSSVNIEQVLSTNFESYEEGLIQCYHTISSIIATFAKSPEFKIDFALSGGIDSRLILATCLKDKAVMDSIQIKTNPHPSRSEDFDVVSSLSEKFGFDANKPKDFASFKSKYSISLNSVPNQVEWWIISNLGLYDMLYLPKYYWNHPALIDLGGHGAESVKGKYLWRNADSLFKNVKEDVRATVSKQMRKGLVPLNFRSSDRESLQFHHLSYTCAVHNSRFLTRTNIALRPFLTKRLFALSKSPVSPHTHQNNYDSSVVHDILIMLNPDLAAEPFAYGKKHISRDYIKAREFLSSLHIRDPVMYEILGSVKDIANGPPDVFLELAKELQIPLGSNVESILHLVQKSWEKVENSSLEPYFDEHYNSSMNKLSKSNAYIPDVGIPASKLSAILLGAL